MKNLRQIKKVLSACKGDLFQQYHVKSLAIFGSYARNEQKQHSDVDILVDFTAPVGVEFIDLANNLESLLEIQVDLVSRKGIRPKYYKEIQSDLIYV